MDHGYGRPEDLEHTESRGRPAGRRPGLRQRPRLRSAGADQVGTLGSGNHFLEVQVVDEIFDPGGAAAFGLFAGQITVMIHCGSRGLRLPGLRRLPRASWPSAAARYGIDLPDRQLACAPVDSPEAGRYLARHGLRRQLRLGQPPDDHASGRRGAAPRPAPSRPQELGLRLVYDVAHNIAKIEEHDVDGAARTALRAPQGRHPGLRPGHPELPAAYRAVGQPVLIPGDMGTASFVCRGTEEAMHETFGSTCHGAGRVMSRSAALKRAQGRAIDRELAAAGVIVRSHGRKTLGEEMPEAYKDVDRVVGVMDRAGISPRVARLRPLGSGQGLRPRLAPRGPRVDKQKHGQ